MFYIINKMKSKSNNLKRLLVNVQFLLLVFASSLSAFGQQTLEREVVVVRPYQPTVGDATKISELPEIKDTVEAPPDIDYSIYPMPLDIDFELEPITAARLEHDPLPELRNSHIKLGFGTYTTPYAELNINTGRNEKYSAGIYLKHRSSHGNIELEDGQDAISGYGDNELLLHGKRMLGNSNLRAEAGITSNEFHYYGYNTSVDTTFQENDIRQNFLRAHASLGFESAKNDSTSLLYDISLDYDHFQDRSKNSEHAASAGAEFQQYISGQVVGLDMNVDYFNNTRVADTSNTVLRASPWVTKADEEWEVSAGFHVYYDYYGETGKTYFYPKANLEFSLVKDYVVPYVGVDGKLDINNYSSVADENFFIVPGLEVENTSNTINLFAGLKGNFTRNISFNASAAYRVYDNMHFFINDSLSRVGNQFMVVYDDIEKFHYSGELKANLGNNLDIMFKGDIYSYEMQAEEHPWHKPETEFSVHAKYNLQDKIIMEADVFHVGERKARGFGPDAEPVVLEGVTDFNLGVEYRLTDVFSAYLRANNITAARYHKWHHYPTQRFSIMGGFTYSL